MKTLRKDNKILTVDEKTAKRLEKDGWKVFDKEKARKEALAANKKLKAEPEKEETPEVK